MLYMTTMSNYSYPTSDFKWVFKRNELEEIKNNIFNFSTDDKTGYLVVCKISIRDELHDKFDAFPLFCEKLRYKGSNIEKLTSTLYPKDFYLVHILYLQFGLKMGYSLEKIYCAIKFTQKKFLTPYLLDLQEKRRENYDNPFLSNLYKLMGKKTFTGRDENPGKSWKIPGYPGIVKGY